MLTSGRGDREKLHKVWYYCGALRSLKSLQDAANQAGPAAAASYSLIGAVVLLGGAGYGLDQWLGTSPWCVLGGLVLGMVVGFYGLVKVTSVRPPADDGRNGHDAPGQSGRDV
jgi:F0F1-type ATP synthase assembly protein I